GITGQLYKQFALTIAVSTAFSGFNALTLTPALCALFLTPKKESNFFIYRWFNKGYGKVLSLYQTIISWMLARPVVSLIIFLVLAGAAFYGFVKWPTSYLPEEDMGYFMTSVQLPTGASVERTEKVVDALAAEIKKIPYVKDVMSISGMSFMGGGASSNMGGINVMLEPWSKRGKAGSIDKVMDMVDEIASRQQEALVFSVNPPAIPGLGMTSGLQMQLLDVNSLGANQLKQALSDIQRMAETDPRIKSVTTMYQGAVPQYTINVDRDRVQLLGIDLSDVYGILASYMGGSFVNDFVDFGRTYQVTVQGDALARDNIGNIVRLSARTADGRMVPFSAFTTVVPSMGEPSVNRYNMYTTASL
ncbi:MAG: efflux RND transporter permease subunit, partial [Muribaculaceae bacterium]|nr:efflux RND transporter permease subunit [Muribaculaceae bacterium]